MKKALFVIDMQNICVGENHAECFQYETKTLLQNVNKVISENNNQTVVYIKNVMKRNFINKFAPFKAYEGTKEVELVENLRMVSDHVYTKYVGDAFSNPELKQFLKEQEIECVELVGVDGGGCVALTAFGAVKNGYQVKIHQDAVGTVFHKKKKKYEKKLKKMGVEFL